MAKITKLIVPNGEQTLSFEVGKTTVEVSEAVVKKIKYLEGNKCHTIFLSDGNEIDIFTRNVITLNKLGGFF